MLAAYADTAPLLVVVDDAHWVDGSTSDALLFAFRRLLADPIAVIVGAREGEASLLDGADLPTVHLEGLDRAAAADLLTMEGARRVPDDLVDRLHRQTGGNPLALVEASVEIDRFRHGEPLDTPLPLVTSVSSVYLSRTRALPAATLHILLLAAANDTGDLSILARAASALGLEVDDLSAAEGAGLIGTREGRLFFRHPLVRSAIYNDASPSSRREVHRALANALPDIEADRRAWHLALSVQGPDDSACSALEQAGARARERSAYDVASRAFERAAQLAPYDSWRGRLLYSAADSAWLGGLALRAQELLDAAATCGLAPELTGSVDNLKGHIAARLGRVGEGQEILAQGAERVAAADPDRAVLMLAEAVNAAFYAGDPEAMRTAGARIAEVAPFASGRLSLFLASMARGLALTLCGEAEDGAVLLRRAVALAEQSNELADDPRLLVWAAMGPLCLREASAGRELITRALDLARSRAAIGVLPYLLSHVAIDQATTNRWAEAEAGFHEVIDLARETHQMTDLAAALSRLAWLEGRQGQGQQSRVHATEAIQLAQELGLRLCEIWATAAVGELELGQGQSSEALAWFKRQESIVRECGIADVDLDPRPNSSSSTFGSGSEARRSKRHRFSSLEPFRRGSRGRWPEPLDAAVFLLMTRQWTESSPARWRSTRRRPTCSRRPGRVWPTGPGCAETARGRAPGTNYVPPSRSSISSGRSRGRGWPAPSWRRREKLLVSVARRHATSSPRRSSRSPCSSLPGGQRGEAAGSLFLSPKTVEYHLRSVYRKLGIASRDELTVAMQGHEAVN